jgi:membrane protease YdiL (CAAX protease family)
MSRRGLALLRLAAFFGFLVGALYPVKELWLRAALHGADPTLRYVVDHLVELAAVLVAMLIASRVERRPFGEFGLPPRQALRSRFWQGAGAGLVSLTVLMLTLQAAGAVHIEIPPTPAARAVGFGGAYGLVFLLLAVREELLYRGYALRTLSEAIPFWPAAAVSTAWFTLAHAGASENAIGLASAAAFGLVACLTLRRTGNLWLALGFHASWDWGETYLFGVRDSGHEAAPGHLLISTVSARSPAWLSGAGVGPEGSILCVALLMVLGLVCLRGLHASSRARGVREFEPS